MECKSFQLAGAYHDNALPSAEREAYRVHLVGCKECAQELAHLQSLSRLLSAAAAPAGRKAVLRLPNLARIWHVRRSLLHWTEMLMAAAMLMFALCGIGLARLGSQPKYGPPMAWEQVAATEQFEPTPEMEAGDLAVQAPVENR